MKQWNESMDHVIRADAAMLIVCGVHAAAPAQAEESWATTPETEEAPAAYVRAPGQEDWPDATVTSVDDGQRRASFAKPAPRAMIASAQRAS